MEEELLKQLEDARDENDEVFSNAPMGMDFKGLSDYMKESNKKVSELSRKYRSIQTPTYSELPDYGDVMSLEHFISCCECGGFINYDGFGRYVKDGKESDVDVYPSDVKNKCIRKDFDTIIWYNR